ncbi:MAG: hypothetical protein GH151_11175 [Bacteroidetes bacterium]|nr:hypothetical protein [Bacteroidota bacterium]
MKRITILFLFLIIYACEKDHSPTKPGFSDMCTIQIIIEDAKEAKKSIPDSLKNELHTNKPAIVNKLEVRVLKSDNSILKSKSFTPSGDYFKGTIKVKAQNDLKVLLIGKNSGVVERFGIDKDVDGQAGKTTTAVISGWNERFIPQIASITPNPSMDGSYTVSWTQPTNATTYTLEEASNDTFSGASTVYSGTALQQNISGKSNGTYYYRVQASNTYNIISGWSESASVLVKEIINEYSISGIITGTDGVLVTLSGDATDTQTVNDGDSYLFTVNESGNYTITPSKDGYTFTPASQIFTNVSTDVNKNFTAIDITSPSVPSEFEIIGIGDGAVTLSWSLVIDKELLGYYVYWQKNAEVDTLNANRIFVTTNSIKITGLDYETLYYFAVTSIDQSGNESSLSLQKAGIALNTTRPSPPSNVAVVAENIDFPQIKVIWSVNEEPDLDHYNVYRALNSADVEDSISFVASVTFEKYYDIDVDIGVSYYYRITAVDKGGLESASSAIDSDYVLDRVKLISPVDEYTGKNPIFKWEKVDGAVSYNIVLKTSRIGVESWNVFVDGSTTQIIYSGATALINGNTYYWEIGAISQTEINSISNLGSFVVY